MLACGLDFGTSNSGLALLKDGEALPLVLDAAHRPPQNLPTLLFFSPDRRQFYGTEAVAEYLDREMDGRFIQSIKRHLPSKAFTTTYVHGRSMDLSELIAGFLEHLRFVAAKQTGQPVTRVLMGRPAVFHVDPERDRLAERRLEQAAYLAGFEEVVFQLEPIAAARAFERRLDGDVRCLVGDLGGGTSDFTVMRLGPTRQGDRRKDVLGFDGVSVAGNDLDAALVKLIVLPRLGYGARYKPLGRPIPVPTKLHVAMTSWHALSFVNTPRNLRELQGWIRTADDAVGLRRLHELLDWNLGFELFRAVERCKVELSTREEGIISFRARGLALEEPVTRVAWEQAIAPLITKIETCVDGLMERLGKPHIDAVFLTGGTSLIPRVRRIFEERFPGRILGEQVFTSVGAGLAVEAQEIWG